MGIKRNEEKEFRKQLSPTTAMRYIMNIPFEATGLYEIKMYPFLIAIA